ncbi:MAG: KamA family radical SAM protein [Chlamydiia bacterium]|nr:KamA family radical SAM protein [Chlamydiia bacterium]
MLPLCVPSAIPFWRELQRENFTRIESLADFLELSASLRLHLLKDPRFILNVPYRLAAKMAKNTLDDPLVRQFLPLLEEETAAPHMAEDPVQDKSFRKTKKLLQKYPGRTLIVTTGACAMHCRYCFRKNFPYEVETTGYAAELAAIHSDPSLTEVILSGGDPLSLSDGALATLLLALDKIPHLKRVRFHSRFPIGIPERIDDSFLNLLAQCRKQIIFVIHCNHPKELDTDVIEALKKIQRLGIPVLNQSVLLHKVNDDEATQLQLAEALVNAGILPYYLHLNDPVIGSGHFDVSQQRGEELIRYLQQHLSGYGIPRLVREIPGELSKTVYI